MHRLELPMPGASPTCFQHLAHPYLIREERYEESVVGGALLRELFLHGGLWRAETHPRIVLFLRKSEIPAIRRQQRRNPGKVLAGGLPSPVIILRNRLRADPACLRMEETCSRGTRSFRHD